MYETPNSHKISSITEKFAAPVTIIVVLIILTLFGVIQAIASGLLVTTTSDIYNIVQSFAVVATGIWAIISFNRNNRIKSTEVLFTLEAEFRNHIDLLVEIESNYDLYLKPILVKEANKAQLSEKETEIISKLDKLLRHLLICKQARNARLDNGILDLMYSYYLIHVLCDKNKSELNNYLKNYWSSIIKWAEQLPRTKINV